MLGRCRRRVVVCDAGRPRNAAAPHAHGFLTRDGMPPLDILAEGRRELQAYDVELRRTDVTDVDDRATRHHGDAAGRRHDHGTQAAAGDRRQDALPDLPGVRDYYGTSIHHCPYCDGWENRDRPLAVYGRPNAASGLAISLLTWSRDVVVCTDGRALGPKARLRLETAGIPARTERITALEGTDGRLARIVFARGAALDRHALFFNTGQTQQSTLAAQLGCRFTGTGHVRCDRERTHGRAAPVHRRRRQRRRPVRRRRSSRRRQGGSRDQQGTARTTDCAATQVSSCDLRRPAAVDDVDGAGRERGFVGPEIDRQHRDLLRQSQPSHRLPRLERGQDLGFVLAVGLRPARECDRAATATPPCPGRWRCSARPCPRNRRPPTWSGR